MSLSVRFAPTLAQKLFTSHFALDPSHAKVHDAPLTLGGNLDPARHFPPQRAKLPDEVSGVRHRDNQVRSTEKPPPAMSLTEARRNQSSVSARSVIALSRIRRTLVCLARRNAASHRRSLPLEHDVPGSVQANCETPDADDNPSGTPAVVDSRNRTTTRQPGSSNGREIGCQRPMERRQEQPCYRRTEHRPEDNKVAAGPAR